MARNRTYNDKRMRAARQDTSSKGLDNFVAGKAMGVSLSKEEMRLMLAMTTPTVAVTKCPPGRRRSS